MQPLTTQQPCSGNAAGARQAEGLVPDLCWVCSSLPCSERCQTDCNQQLLSDIENNEQGTLGRGQQTGEGAAHPEHLGEWEPYLTSLQSMHEASFPIHAPLRALLGLLLGIWILLASPSLILCYLSLAKAAGLSTTIVSHHFKHTRFTKFNKFCYNSCRLKRDFLMGDTRLNCCPFVPFAASAVGHSKLLACFLKHCSLCSLDRVFLVPWCIGKVLQID